MAEKKSVRQIDLSRQTPKMQIEKPEIGELYKKAFLVKQEKHESDYSKNTTTWE